MKALLFVLTILPTALLAQQPTTWTQNTNGGKSGIVEGSDGAQEYVSYYANGQVESERAMQNNRIEGLYKRYYKNGQLMWEKYMRNNQENGEATYYNMRGKKVARLLYKDGTIADTLFIATQQTIVLGKVTGISVVHGGMDRGPDYHPPKPTARPWMHYAMIVGKLATDSSKAKEVQRFETDAFGMFFICLDKGTYGFFPGSTDMTQLQAGQFAPQPQMGMSHQSSWNMHEPLRITSSGLTTLHLHHSSEGWAP